MGRVDQLWVRALTVDVDRTRLQRLIADYGVDGTINAEECSEASPLWFALSHSNWPLATWLIDQGADVNFVSGNGETPLHATAGDDAAVELAKLLIDKGARLDVRAGYEGSGSTALEIAITYGCPAMVKLLLERGASREGALELCKSIVARHPTPRHREMLSLIQPTVVAAKPTVRKARPVK